MRKRLNLLCVIVLAVLGWSVIESGYYLVMGASMGFQAGWNAAEADHKKVEPPTDVSKFANMKGIHLKPQLSVSQLMKDSVYNEKGGSYVPATYMSMLVSVPTAEEGMGRSLVRMLLSFVNIGCGVWALVLFVRLVVSINRFDIFSWRNVRRLRLLGLALVANFVCEVILVWMGIASLESVFALRGYELSFSDMVERTTLVLGICSLIVGEVFAIGLHMKEEQDLTI